MTDFKTGDHVHLKSGANKHGFEPLTEDGSGEAAAFEVLEIKGRYEHETAAGKLPWATIRGLAKPHDFEQVVHSSRLIPIDQ